MDNDPKNALNKLADSLDKINKPIVLPDPTPKPELKESEAKNA
jgi:hypothetical protein